MPVPLRDEFRADVELVVIGALIFVASFAWRDFFSDVEEVVAPKTQGLLGRFVFVVVETIVIVLLIMLVRRLLRHRNGPAGAISPWYLDATQAEAPGGNRSE